MIPSITSMKDAFSLKGMNALITGGNRGLGLAIAKEVMSKLGVEICLQSAPGAGSEFSFVLPPAA